MFTLLAARTHGTRHDPSRPRQRMHEESSMVGSSELGEGALMFGVCQLSSVHMVLHLSVTTAYFKVSFNLSVNSIKALWVSTNSVSLIQNYPTLLNIY